MKLIDSMVSMQRYNPIGIMVKQRVGIAVWNKQKGRMHVRMKQAVDDVLAPALFEECNEIS